MPDREIPGSFYDSETQNKILDTATELFALKGYGAVSMRDIAKIVGIKMSSIYYYYDGKEALLDDVFKRFERGYRHYFDWLTAMNKEAESFEEVMDIMFNSEFRDMRDPLSCLGMSLIIKEQHNHESARKLVFDLFYDFSVKRMKAYFDNLIEKSITPPTDTRMIAILFMFGVIAYNDIKVQEYAGIKPPINSMEIFNDMRQMVTISLTHKN